VIWTAGAAVVERRAGGGVQRLVLLLLRDLLEREEAIFPHLDPLGHVAHAGVFCKWMKGESRSSFVEVGLKVLSTELIFLNLMRKLRLHLSCL